jgi:hypothetical protein
MKRPPCDGHRHWLSEPREDNAIVRQFGKSPQTAPVVQKHYEMARELEEKMYTMAMKASK